MMDEIPYWARVVTLLVFLSALAGIEIARVGKSATRWKEYPLMLAIGLAAGVFGLVNDLLTSWISPEYFSLGKGLGTDDLRWNAAILGLKAGFSAGAIGGGICVWAATRRSPYPALPLGKLTLLLWRPFLLAPLLAAVFYLAFSRLDPFDYKDPLSGILDPAQIARFLKVWWIHLGLYTGLLFGVIWIAIDVRKLRRRGHIVEKVILTR